ncbi:MAG: hypothetical protein ABL962_17330, partial [Fimbriimonadaceae bacterium]
FQAGKKAFPAAWNPSQAAVIPFQAAKNGSQAGRNCFGAAWNTLFWAVSEAASALKPLRINEIAMSGGLPILTTQLPDLLLQSLRLGFELALQPRHTAFALLRL